MGIQGGGGLGFQFVFIYQLQGTSYRQFNTEYELIEVDQLLETWVAGSQTKQPKEQMARLGSIFSLPIKRLG